ncbi:MAG: stage II sporulation protein D [Planctomycetaceae bacterium]|jgi:stage II sporulation protein D
MDVARPVIEQKLVSRRRMLAAAAVSAVPLSVGAWHLSSKDSSGQSSSNAASATQSAAAPDTWNPFVRVNLTPSPLTDLTISIDGPFRVLAPGSAKILAQSVSVKDRIVSAEGNGIRVGDEVFPISQIEIVTAKSPSIWVGRNQYRGSIRIFRRPGGRLIAVNLLPLEEYLASVVNSEMPATFPDEAREAQTIAARTYVLSQMKGHPQFDVYATSRSQRYLGYQYLNDEGRRLAGETQGSRDIVGRTAGIVCTWEGKVFTTFYTAVCGGRTTLGRSVFKDAVPAMASVECDWCREADRYRWTSTLPVDRLSKSLQEHFADLNEEFGQLKSLQPSFGDAGDLPFYMVSDGVRTKKIAGTELRHSLPIGTLSSPRFTAEIDATEVRFSGAGHGHGVGFCQWGSRGLALAGRSALQILQYYYPGSATVRLRG